MERYENEFMEFDSFDDIEAIEQEIDELYDDEEAES